jgi:uncharacterized protein YndB with AHSA1/START domain
VRKRNKRSPEKVTKEEEMMTTAPEKTNVTTPGDREVVVVRRFHASRGLLWEAWTNPKYLPQWLVGPDGWTMPICDIDLKVGGMYWFVWWQEDGAEMVITGTYKEIVPRERLVAAETWGGSWPETLNTMTFTEFDGMTTIEMRVRYLSKVVRNAALGTGMAEGMSMCYERLDVLLATMA